MFQDDPLVSDLQISPSELYFTENDGVRDTLVTFQVSARSDLPDNYSLVAVLASASDRELIDTDTLIATGNAGQFHGTLSAEMQTTDQRNLVMYVYSAGHQSGIANRSESVIKVRGTTSGFPEVLQVDHPDTVFIPSPGDTTNFNITAEVTHSASISLIDRVWLELYDKDDIRIYRDNMDEFESETGDSRYYSKGFSLHSDNSPDSITVQVYAQDIAGSRSDTLRSHFIIAR